MKGILKADLIPLVADYGFQYETIKTATRIL